jgi:hypothetical protein
MTKQGCVQNRPQTPAIRIALETQLLSPGKHTLYSKAENWAELPFEAKEGDIIFAEQETNMGVIMARNNLLKIEEVPGKYHVKKLSLGTISKTEK